MTQTSPPKSVEEIVIEVMKPDKAVEFFQTVAITSLNMGNLTLEVNTLINIFVTREKEKVVLQDELDKEREFQHNVEIQRKNRAQAKQKNEVLINKLQDENEELKCSTTRLKSQDEKLQNLRQKVEI